MTPGCSARQSSVSNFRLNLQFFIFNLELSRKSNWKLETEFMDVYHKVLVKLYEMTGGRYTQAVDFKDLVRSQGFHGNYEDIFQKLSVQGWIAETPKANFVKITHWGVKEAQKASSGTVESASADSKELRRAATELIGDTREFLIILEEFTRNLSEENFKQAERKFGELNSAFLKIKQSI